MQLFAWADVGFLILAQQGNQAADPNAWLGPVLNLVLPAVGILAIFYFVVMGPEARMRDEQAKALASIKKNDKVLTQGGIIGVVTKVSADDKILTIRTAESTYLDVYRSYITRKVTDTDSGEAAKTG